MGLCMAVDDVLVARLERIIAFIRPLVNYASIINPFKASQHGDARVEAYDESCVIFHEGERYDLDLVMIGIHHDDRVENGLFSPIIIIQGLAADDMYSPAAHDAPAYSPSPAKRIRLDEEGAICRRILQQIDESDEEEEEVPAEEEACEEKAAGEEENVSDDAVLIVKVERRASRHQMSSKTSRWLWGATKKNKKPVTDAYRQSYFKCAHQKYICPECVAGLDSWLVFEGDHSGCKGWTDCGTKNKKESCHQVCGI
jgi:hypothetical protein